MDCTPCGAVNGVAIVPTDTDTDSTPDYLDTETDGDTVLDIIEAHDSDLDGFADWDANTNMALDPGEVSAADADSDGLLDDFDPDFIACSFTDFNQPTNGGCASLQDRNSDGIRDWRDPTSAPLPIELLSFEAIVSGNGVDLLWSTASETNNDFFTIERTEDLVEWEIVTSVPGAGDSDIVTDYASRDNVPFEGVSFYRLKQTDFDGQFSYSDIERIVFTASDAILVFPNPVQHEVTISSGKLLDPSKLMMFNNIGQLVEVKWFQLNPKSIKLLTDGLATGVYQLNIHTENGLVIKRLIKIR